MFCCKSKDDGASPVKKSKKVNPIKMENKDDGLKLKPIQTIPDSSLDHNGANGHDTPVNQQQVIAGQKVQLENSNLKPDNQKSIGLMPVVQVQEEKKEEVKKEQIAMPNFYA